MIFLTFSCLSGNVSNGKDSVIRMKCLFVVVRRACFHYIIELEFFERKHIVHQNNYLSYAQDSHIQQTHEVNLRSRHAVNSIKDLEDNYYLEKLLERQNILDSRTFLCLEIWEVWSLLQKWNFGTLQAHRSFKKKTHSGANRCYAIMYCWLLQWILGFRKQKNNKQLSNPRTLRFYLDCHSF